VCVCVCVCVCVLDAVYEAAGEQPRAAVPLQRALEPAVFSLPVDEHDVTLLELQLRLALGGVGDHHPVPGGGGGDREDTHW